MFIRKHQLLKFFSELGSVDSSILQHNMQYAELLVSRLESIVPSNNIIPSAYSTSKELHENNTPSWLSSINAILEHFPDIYSIKVNSVSANTFKKQVHTAYRSLHFTHWVDNRQDNLNSKLKPYTTFKWCFFFKEKIICQL